jgi:hypothetical protein
MINPDIRVAPIDEGDRSMPITQNIQRPTVTQILGATAQ